MLKKHSTTLRGHRTSITLEDPFWEELRRLAAERGLALARLIAEIDAAREADTNLSSALRLHVLAAIKAEATRQDAAPAEASRQTE